MLDALVEVVGGVRHAVGRALHNGALARLTGLGFDFATLWVLVGNERAIGFAYAIASAGFLLFGGRATDVLGRRRMLVSGLALYAVASLAGTVAGHAGPARDLARPAVRHGQVVWTT